MSGELILIVEDDQNSRILLRDALAIAEYRTIETDNAEAVLALARQHSPRLVLMDIQLQRMSGIEAFRALRQDQQTRGIPVIAVTASVMDDQRREIAEAGFDGFEQKPISVSRLLRLIRLLLSQERVSAAQSPGNSP